jgi:hypothetical protein
MLNEVIINKILEASLLVLLMGVVYVYTVDMGSNSVIYIPSFMKILSSIQAILRYLPLQSQRM